MLAGGNAAAQHAPFRKKHMTNWGFRETAAAAVSIKITIPF
jgi:hypothetical protein